MKTKFYYFIIYSFNYLNRRASFYKKNIKITIDEILFDNKVFNIYYLMNFHYPNDRVLNYLISNNQLYLS